VAGRLVFSMMKQVRKFEQTWSVEFTGCSHQFTSDTFHTVNSDGSPYFYETRNWTFSSLLPSFTRAEPAKPKVDGTRITDAERETYTKMKRYAPPEAVRSMMLVKGIRKKDIDKLLST